MMPYANAKASEGHVTCFTVFVALGKFEIWAQIGPKYLKSWWRETQTIIQSLQLIMSYQMMRYSDVEAI